TEEAYAESGFGQWGFLIFLLGIVVGIGLVVGLSVARRVLPQVWAVLKSKKDENEDELVIRPGPPLWHQRKVYGVVAHSDGKLYEAATADWHAYAEDWSAGSAEVVAARWCANHRDLPAGVARDQVHRFRREPTPARDAAFRQAAEAEAEAEGRTLLGAQGVPLPAGQLVGPGAGAVVPADVLGDAVAAPAAPVGPPAGGGAVVAAVPAPAAAAPPRLQGPLQGVAPAVALPGAAMVRGAAGAGGGYRFGGVVPGHARSARASGSKNLR
ncbi:unnamed protein product, partial [Prorocentrum cordatum]